MRHRRASRTPDPVRCPSSALSRRERTLVTLARTRLAMLGGMEYSPVPGYVPAYCKLADASRNMGRTETILRAQTEMWVREHCLPVSYTAQDSRKDFQDRLRAGVRKQTGSPLPSDTYPTPSTHLGVTFHLRPPQDSEVDRVELFA